MQNLETLILNHLLFDDIYLRKVLPFLKAEYFKISSQRKIFENIEGFVERYNNPPSKEALAIGFQNDSTLSEEEFSEVIEIIDGLDGKMDNNIEWMIDETEKFCRDRAILLALTQSIKIANGDDDKLTPDAIPSIMGDALAVCFDPNVGMDYVDDAGDRYDYYNRVEERITCDLDIFNKITNGGIPRKTLNVIQAGIHVGKTLMLCHLAAAYQNAGYNVLYITLEMSQEQIASRIDANMLNLDIGSLGAVSREVFDERIEKVKNRSTGKLIIKEYPTGSAHVGHFRALMTELKMKRGFVPDVLLIDYLNICASSRIKNNGTVNSYTVVKSIAEEVRGLMMEKNMVGWSATQSTRAGSEKSDPTMTDASESFGTPATSDMYLSAVSSEELAMRGQIMITQLKNRYRNFMETHKFVIGVDIRKMRLYDVEEPTKNLISSGSKVEVIAPPTTPKAITAGNFRNSKFGDIKV